MDVKGLELPYHDPRFSWGQAISQSTGNRGACHLTSGAHNFEQVRVLPELGYPKPVPGRQREGKAQHTIHCQDYMNILDSLVACKLTLSGIMITDYRNWYNMITGADLELDPFMAVGKRGFTLKRMINNRRGVTRKDDWLPSRMLTLKKVGENIDFDVPPLEQLLSDYYDLRGWTEEGRPSSEVIKELGLDDFTGLQAP